MNSTTAPAQQQQPPSSNSGTPITIPYSLLLSPTSDLAPLLSSAFSSSPSALGLLLISDLPPAFPALRRRLLLLSNTFASLPEATREKYADASSKWSFGWRCVRAWAWLLEGRAHVSAQLRQGDNRSEEHTSELQSQ